MNVTRLQSIHRGTSSTSSCSTFTHSTGPMPSGNANTSGSLNGSVVNQPRPFSQTTGGFRHSSIVVQMENVGANRCPSITMFAPSRTPISSISRNSVSAAYRANTSAAPGSTPTPTNASCPRLSHTSAIANWSSPSFLPVSSCGASGCGSDNDIAMSRYVAPTSSAPLKIGMTKRGSAAFKMASHPLARAQSATCVASVASIAAAENVPPAP